MLHALLLLQLAAAAPAASTAATPGAPERVSAPRRKTKVAVSELEAGVRADPKLTHLITGLITSELRRRPALAVTSQEDIKALLGFERQKALLGCSDTSCLAEIGGALGVDHMVTGSLSSAGESLVLLVRLVDVHKGVVLQDVSRRFPKASEEALLDSIPAVAAALYPELLPEAAPAAVAPAAAVQASPSRRSNAPWWLAGAGALVAAAGGGLLIYVAASQQSRTAGGVTSYQITESGARTDNALGYAGQATLGVGAAVLVGGALWGLLRPPPEPAP